MRSMKDILAILCEFDNAGFQDTGPLNTDSKDFDKFQLINVHNKESEQYLRKHLRGREYWKCDRVSMSQFLSLFNVIGVANAATLDKLGELLEKKLSTGSKGK